MSNKTLLFYWYVRNDGWHDLYDFHLKNLEAYKDVFDSAIFIISHDDDTKQKYIEAVIEKLKNIYPDAEYRCYRNDKKLRESKYVYEEIALKLKDMPDQWYFWGHCKGIDSKYVSMPHCYKWVAGMYFMNLYFIDEVEKYMNDSETCTIGTYLMRNYKAWSFLKYQWHFSGTFWWFNPHRIYELIIKLGNKIPLNDKYFSEGFFGSVIPDNEKYRKPSLLKYNANHYNGFFWMTEEMRKNLITKLNCDKWNSFLCSDNLSEKKNLAKETAMILYT